MQYIYVLDYSTPSRVDNVSDKVHPNMQLVAKKIKDIIENF